MLKTIFIFYFSSCFTYGENSLNQGVKEESVDKKKEIISKNQQAASFSKTNIQAEQSAKDYLIEKLDYLNEILPKNHKARKPLNLRLAHILSLKAEENFIKAEKENCQFCRKVAQSSARRSLSIYKNLDSHIETRHPLLHTESLFKRAYLHRFLGEKSKSLEKLNRIVVKSTITPSLINRAWFNIGEIQFELYNYEKSLEAFNKVLKQAESPWRFQALYRKIWSLSNLSLYEKSVDELESFLKTDLYSEPKLSLEEEKLKQKLENELIALYNYAKITDDRLDFFYNFSKQNKNKNTLLEKNNRLFDLAQALNRIGRMGDSNKVWHKYLSKTSLLNKKSQAYFFMIDNDLILNKPNLLQDTGQKIEKIFALQKKTKSSNDFKSAFNKQAKFFFNQINQTSFSEDQKNYLLDLYQKYNSIYPRDIDILPRAAFLARNLKKYVLAQDLFQTAVLSMDSYGNKKASKADIKENMSLLQMEMAEFTKDVKSRLNAYDFYIGHGRNEELIYKAKYQKSYISYENKEYEKAADLFQNLALYKAKKRNLKKLQDLRLKSAHLSLSALDRLGHQEEKLARRAGLFMKAFPQNRREFVRIYHAALLNTVKKLVFGKDFSHRPIQSSSDKNILKAWEVLQLISVKEAAKEEVLTYHINRLLLAKELLKFELMDQSIQALLSDKNLKKEDQKMVLTWKLWLAELRFDFKEVLRVVKILQPEEQSEEQVLRLARLAELAGKNPIPYYKTFVKKFPNSQLVTAVLTSMVEKSPYKNKKIVLQKYAPLFKNQPDTLTYLVLKVDRGQMDEKFIKSFVFLDFMKDTPLFSFLQRKETIESFEKELAHISSYSLPERSSGNRLTRAIKNYSNKVDKLGSKAEEALKTQGLDNKSVYCFPLGKRDSPFL